MRFIDSLPHLRNVPRYTLQLQKGTLALSNTRIQPDAQTVPETLEQFRAARLATFNRHGIRLEPRSSTEQSTLEMFARHLDKHRPKSYEYGRAAALMCACVGDPYSPGSLEQYAHYREAVSVRCPSGRIHVLTHRHIETDETPRQTLVFKRTDGSVFEIARINDNMFIFASKKIGRCHWMKKITYPELRQLLTALAIALQT